MNVRKQFTITVALMALALGLTIVPASAQQIINGTFELPAAAYLGNTLLQPGQYSIWISPEGEFGEMPVIHLSGEGIRTTVLAIATPQHESSRNFLEIADVNGTYVVRAFDAGLLGKSFTFGVTKTVKNKALRASAEPAMESPVSLGAGF
jgi:hypothetical protein